MWLRENKYVQSTGETDALQCKSKSMHWRHSVRKYRKEVWLGLENLEKLTAKVSHICRIKVYSVKILNLFQVRVDSGEDDGEAEREDEHGEVDDVDRPHPGFPGCRIFDDRLNQFGRSRSVRRIFRDFTRWHFRFRILSRAGKTLSGNRLFSEWFEHLQKKSGHKLKIDHERSSSFDTRSRKIFWWNGNFSATCSSSRPQQRR